MLIIVLQLFFVYKGIENVPFFHYGMFSEKITKSTKKYFVEVDGKEINLSKSIHYNKNVLLYNIENYETIIAGDLQINRVIQKRFHRFQSKELELYFTNSLTNNDQIETYQKWIINYIKQDYPLCKSISFGYHIIDSQLMKKQTIYFINSINEGN